MRGVTCVSTDDCLFDKLFITLLVSALSSAVCAAAACWNAASGFPPRRRNFRNSISERRSTLMVVVPKALCNQPEAGRIPDRLSLVRLFLTLGRLCDFVIGPLVVL